MSRIKSIMGIVLLFFSLLSCTHEEKKENVDEFTRHMGYNKPVWQNIKTAEDFKKLEFFQKIYEGHRNHEHPTPPNATIPKIIHVIWLGHKEFSKASLNRLHSWVNHHPDWQIKFWTDRKRQLSNSKIELKLVDDFSFTRLKKHFDEADNYAEKATILRYEILLQEGGLYVDHDVKCYLPFNIFHAFYDFYCALNPPGSSVLSSVISIDGSVIGARPQHPIIKKCIETVERKWDKYSRAFPGQDKESIIYRVTYRTLLPLEKAFIKFHNQKGYHDIVLPAAYFNRIGGDLGLFAHHFREKMWYEDDKKFDRAIKERFTRISKKQRQVLFFTTGLFCANLLLFLFLGRHLRTIRKKR